MCVRATSKSEYCAYKFHDIEHANILQKINDKME